jgi:putative glutathione S-transferase
LVSNQFVDQIDFEELWSTPQTRRFLSRTPEEKFLRKNKK